MHTESAKCFESESEPTQLSTMKAIATDEGLHGHNILHSLRVHSCASMLNNICSESMSTARMRLYSIGDYVFSIEMKQLTAACSVELWLNQEGSDPRDTEKIAELTYPELVSVLNPFWTLCTLLDIVPV